MIWALTVATSPTDHLVWAFDIAQEYLDAIQVAHAFNLPFVAYHGVERLKGGGAGRIAKHAITFTDSEWILASEGVNDSDEFKTWCDERHNLKKGLTPCQI